MACWRDRVCGDSQISRGTSTATEAPILGIVSHADLKLGDAVVEVLEAHREAAGLLRVYDIL